MLDKVTFLNIGGIEDPPVGQRVQQFPLVPRHKAELLYLRRHQAVQSVRTPYFCFLDGGGDRLGKDFLQVIDTLVRAMEKSRAAIGYMGELLHGKNLGLTKSFTLESYLRNFQMIHHGVVCRTAAARKIEWPRGVYSYEILGYGLLAQQGFEVVQEPIYEYNPDSNGARLWPSYCRAIVNSQRALRGLPGIHMQGEQLPLDWYLPRGNHYG